MNIQWYPGHMAKTKRLISDNLKLVDVVIEIVDARIPLSSRNPETDKLIGSKPRVIVFNKSDLSDENINKQWIQFFKNKSIKVVLIDSIRGTGLKELLTVTRELAKPRLDYEKSRGRLSRAVRAMVIGIPNVGKSSLINKLVGKAVTITGDKPGVTKGKQWVRISKDIELIDMPGILWPKFDDPEVGKKLAFTGAIKDEIVDIVELSANLLEYLKELYPQQLMQRYKLNDNDIEGTGIEILTTIGKKRGAIILGGEIDYNRIAQVVLDEFRGAKIGKVTLDRPSDME